MTKKATRDTLSMQEYLKDMVTDYTEVALSLSRIYDSDTEVAKVLGQFPLTK